MWGTISALFDKLFVPFTKVHPLKEDAEIDVYENTHPVDTNTCPEDGKLAVVFTVTVGPTVDVEEQIATGFV